MKATRALPKACHACPVVAECGGNAPDAFSATCLLDREDYKVTVTLNISKRGGHVTTEDILDKLQDLVTYACRETLTSMVDVKVEKQLDGVVEKPRLAQRALGDFLLNTRLGEPE